MQNIYAIILAGGTGARIGNELPKQFLDIAGKPLIIHTLNKFTNPDITGIIIVIAEGYIEYINELIKKHATPNVFKVITGGATRQESSYNAVKCMDFDENDILIFHDAARPFVSHEIIDTCINETADSGACAVYIKATDTIAKITSSYVNEIPSRDYLYYSQTPQCFRFDIIKKAHDYALSIGIDSASDDVSLVLDIGCKVKVIEGKPENLKITNPLDMQLAKIIIGSDSSRSQSGNKS